MVPVGLCLGALNDQDVMGLEYQLENASSVVGEIIAPELNFGCPVGCGRTAPPTLPFAGVAN